MIGLLAWIGWGRGRGGGFQRDVGPGDGGDAEVGEDGDGGKEKKEEKSAKA